MTNRLACIFAHPDDETFCVGGTIAKYAAAGIPTDLYCATDGDAGRNSSVPVASREELAAVRREELDVASLILGIASVTRGAYGDGVLDQVESTEMIGEMVAFLRRSRPTVVVTFGPEGAPTAHRDHRVISRAATAAFFLAGLRTAYPGDDLPPHQAARLYYHAWPFPHVHPDVTIESVPATAAIDVRAWNERKLAAFNAHATQQHARDLFLGAVLLDTEQFALAAGTPQPALMINDLFDGN